MISKELRVPFLSSRLQIPSDPSTVVIDLFRPSIQIISGFSDRCQYFVPVRTYISVHRGILIWIQALEPFYFSLYGKAMHVSVEILTFSPEDVDIEGIYSQNPFFLPPTKAS